MVVATDLSIIIVNWNTRDLLLQCLKTVNETAHGFTYEIIIVDNASTDRSVETVKARFGDVKLICNAENLGFARANNIALEMMGGRYALLLNTDTRVEQGAIEALYTFMEAHPESGMACGQLLNPDGSKQNSVANFPTFTALFFNETLMRVLFPHRFPSKRQNYTQPIEIESGIGACLIIRKQTMERVGLLDESYFFFLEETDWALRMRMAGWKVFFVPAARIIHEQGKSVGHGFESRMLYYRSRYVYFKKWYPHAFHLYCTLVFVRLILNTGLTLAGMLMSVGMHQNLNKKAGVYIKLLIWHLKGCP